MRFGILLGLTALVIGCTEGEQASPQVLAPAEFDYVRGGRPQGRDADAQVLAAAFDWLIANTLRAGSPDAVPPTLIVKDETLPICTNHRELCVPADLIISELKEHPDWGENAVSAFWAQNRVRSIATSPRNERIRFVSVRDDLSQRVQRGNWWEAVQSAFPQGSRLVSVGSPVYPSHNTAIVYFVQPADGGGVLLLVREGRGWRIADRDGWTS
jgi:hypothetical protein